MVNDTHMKYTIYFLLAPRISFLQKRITVANEYGSYGFECRGCGCRKQVTAHDLNRCETDLKEH
jgi:hypothetical protein